MTTKSHFKVTYLRDNGKRRKFFISGMTKPDIRSLIGDHREFEIVDASINRKTMTKKEFVNFMMKSIYITIGD